MPHIQFFWSKFLWFWKFISYTFFFLKERNLCSFVLWVKCAGSEYLSFSCKDFLFEWDKHILCFAHPALLSLSHCIETTPNSGKIEGRMVGIHLSMSSWGTKWETSQLFSQTLRLLQATLTRESSGCRVLRELCAGKACCAVEIAQLYPSTVFASCPVLP